ncbi:MAG: glycosyltransferase family 39 protein [Anaerolineae bacterium]|nr:glycosyltransferase family 39 protein [Anaerolineae bacterium]
MSRSLAVHRVVLLLIILLACVLRFYRLSAQSFWNDEGNSARIAERPLQLIWEGAAADIHPPGYYLLLHYWRALCGHSEFALRSFSALVGVLTVVFTFLLGRRLFDKRVGVMAAFIAALSPFAIYYAQEARMYALLGLFSALSTYLLVAGPVHLYPVACVAGLYTHYAFPFVLLVHNLWVGLWWLRRAEWQRWLMAWAGMQVIIVLLYLPWLPIALRSVTGWPAAAQEYRVGEALLDMWRVLTVGQTLPLTQASVALGGTAVLFVAALWPRRAPGMGPAIVGMMLYLVVPVCLIFALGLYKPEWLKFLVVVLPPFHILLALGAKNAGQLVSTRPGLSVAFSVLLLLPGLFPVGVSLHNLYFNPLYARDDYRGIAALIASRFQPGDAIVLNAPNQWEVFTYYYPDRDVYPAPYRPDPSEVEGLLLPLTERYRRLFVLYWGDAESDPRRLIESWLAEHAYKATDSWHGRVRLSLYGVASLPAQPSDYMESCFGEGICLQGYALPGRQFSVGEVVPVTLFWEARENITERYKVTVQLLDGSGRLVAQCDTEPRAGLLPTDRWEEGLSLTDRYGLLLPPALPPGRYELIVAVYHAFTGIRLPVESLGDHVHIAWIEVVAR